MRVGVSWGLAWSKVLLLLGRHVAFVGQTALLGKHTCFSLGIDAFALAFKQSCWVRVPRWEG